MRQKRTLLKHFPLIKFVGGPHSHTAGAANPHPLSSTARMPTLKEAIGTYLAPIQLKEGEVLFRCKLSKRFRYTVPSEVEIEQVESGGADLVF